MISVNTYMQFVTSELQMVQLILSAFCVTGIDLSIVLSSVRLERLFFVSCIAAAACM